MPIGAEQLFPQHMLGHAVEMMQHRHPAPAHAKGRMHVGLGPVHDRAQLVPIADLFVVQMLDRGAGDDQPVEFLVRHVRKRAVKALHMLGGRVLGLVIGHADQRQFDLQRRGPDQAGKLRLCLDLFRHQVQQRDFQRANVLMGGQFVIHYHHALFGEDGIGGQGARQFQRHWELSGMRGRQARGSR